MTLDERVELEMPVLSLYAPHSAERGFAGAELDRQLNGFIGPYSRAVQVSNSFIPEDVKATIRQQVAARLAETGVLP